MTNRTDHAAPRERVAELDALRFVAASMVVFYHLTFYGFAAGQLSPLAFPAVNGVSRYGGLGVNLFFIISGFVILMTAQRSTPAQFVVARAVRLYPAYWACCTLTYATLLLLPHPQFTVTLRQYLVNLTMVSPLAGIEYLDGVYWSLFVELRFYLLVFALLVLGLLTRARTFLGVWLAVSALAQLHVAETRATNLLLLTDWSPYFIAGAMFHCVRQRGRWDAYSAAVVTAAGGLTVRQAIDAAATEGRALGELQDPRVVAAVVIAFFLVFAVLATRREPRIQLPGAVALGGLTYPLYLLHQRIGYTLLQRADRVSASVWLVGLMAGALAASFAVHRYIERPLQRWLRPALNAYLGVPARQPVADTPPAAPPASAGPSCD